MNCMLNDNDKLNRNDLALHINLHKQYKQRTSHTMQLLTKQSWNNLMLSILKIKIMAIL